MFLSDQSSLKFLFSLRKSILQHIIIIISFSLFLDHFHLVSLIFYHFQKSIFLVYFHQFYYFLEYFQFLYSIQLIFIFLDFILYISGIFGFLDSIPLHFIFLESKDSRNIFQFYQYFWRPPLLIFHGSFSILTVIL